MNTKIKFLAVAALAALGATACKAGQAEDAPNIQTAVVNRGNLRIAVEATGSVEPVRSVDVKSKASGQILQLVVDVGDSVHAGTILAKIDPRDVNNNFQQAQANLEVAKAQAANAKAQLDRSKALLDSGVITQQEYESNNLSYVTARSSLVRAQTNWELAKLQLADVTIMAPIDGTIISKGNGISEGAVIQSGSSGFSGGTTLFTMANLDSMQVRTQVDETDVGQLHAGLPATIKVEAYPSRTFQGRVEKIEPQAVTTQNVTMFNVIVSIDNKSGLLKPGMNGDVEILVNQADNVLLIPNNAIVERQDVGPAAMVLGMNVDSLDFRSLAGRGARSGTASARGANGANGGAQQAGREGLASRNAGRAGASAQNGSGTQTAYGQRTMPEGMRAELDSLRAKAGRGEITQDSMRAALRAMREQAGGTAGGTGATATDPTSPNGHSAVVFVVNNGKPQVRVVQVGLNDWDSTEILDGLAEGDSVAVIGALQLQAQQQQFMDRMRNRSGGLPFGGGGRGGRR